MDKNNFKSENGAITLFVLLAMLFFTTISLTAFISTSNSASNQEEYISTIKQTYEKDANNIDEVYNRITGKVNSDAGSEVEIPTKWKIAAAYTAKDSDGTVVSKTAYASTVYAVDDGKNNAIPIPYGFYYVGGTLDTGIVISDDEVDKGKYAGYTDVPNDLTGNQFVWIPCELSNYVKYNWGYADADGWDKSTNSAEKTQIQKYGGFYVARYEAGTSAAIFNNVTVGDAVTTTTDWQSDIYSLANASSDSKPTSKANEIPWFHADYNTAITMSERMYNTSYVNSGLITGTEWDVMLNFMSDETNKSISNANNSNNYTDLKLNSIWGNYSDVTLNDCTGRYCTYSTGSTSAWQQSDGTNRHSSVKTLLSSGASETAKKKNLYDVAGNLFELTQETSYKGNNTEYYMLRGGTSSSSYKTYTACQRLAFSSSGCDTDIGFRVVLYMK